MRCHCRRPLGGGDNVVGRPVPISRVSFTTTVFWCHPLTFARARKTRDEAERERVPRFRFWEALIGPDEGIVAKHGAWPGLLAGNHPPLSRFEPRGIGKFMAPIAEAAQGCGSAPREDHVGREYHLGHVGRGSSPIFQTSASSAAVFRPIFSLFTCFLNTFKKNYIFYGTISHW